MAEPTSIPSPNEFRNLEKGFAERSGEIFRTVINLETVFELGQIGPADAESLAGPAADERVVVSSVFVKGLPGEIVFLLEKDFTAKVVDFMIMGDGQVEFMPDEHLDGIVEAINQLMGNELTELSGRFSLSLRNDVKPASLIAGDAILASYAGWAMASFQVSIDGQPPATLWKLFSPELVERLGAMLGGAAAEAAAPAREASSSAAGDTVIADGMEKPAAPGGDGGAGSGGGETKEARRAQFTDFGPGGRTAEGGLQPVMNDGLGRVMDLRLPIVIELGRTRMLIKDIVELGPGSIIELNKLVGEPVDLFVNGKKFAMGEVVVIDENFGVRITDLIPLEQRMKQVEEA